MTTDAKEAEKPSKYRRQPDADLSRMEIMRGAAECFKERGFAATSIDEVALRIRSTKGRIYHHYASKAELFFDVYRTGMDMNRAAIEPFLASDLKAAEKLKCMLKAHVLSMIRTQAFQRVVWDGVEMLRTGAMPAPQREELGELVHLRDTYAAYFATVMEQARCEGELAFRTLSIALNAMFMAVNGPVFWFEQRPDQSEQEIEDIAEECVLYAMRALGYRG
jgi:AcrR family transcriptional regulator